jgi:trigger factor
MQVTETLVEGLKRELKVVIPAKDMEAQLNERLADAKDKVRINGFRPGKVPMSHMKQQYGKSVMAELVNEIIQERPTAILAERGEKSATRPEINMTEDQDEAEEILNAKRDFEFSIVYEAIPEFDVADLTQLSITRQVVAIEESEVEEQVLRVAESARTYDTKKGKAADKDRVTMDYLGKIDGEAFDGGAAEDAQLVLGSNQFIPGFEEQLVGVKAGDETVVTVNFPDDYQAAHLAGKEAKFDIKVKEVSAPAAIEINDELATNLGLDSAEKLREVVREQIEGQYGQLTRQKVKRQILDQMDELHKFEAPSKLVESEFDNIWRQVETDLEQNGKTFADEDTTEEKARKEYTELAERRVRLGLVLSKVGEAAEIDVTEEELQRSLFEQVRQFPGQEQEIYKYFQETPGAAQSLRAPIFEEKTIDHLMTIIQIKDETVTKEQLTADEDEAEDKPVAKKAAPKKKAAAKKKAED